MKQLTDNQRADMHEAAIELTLRDLRAKWHCSRKEAADRLGVGEPLSFRGMHYDQVERISQGYSLSV